MWVVALFKHPLYRNWNVNFQVFKYYEGICLVWAQHPNTSKFPHNGVHKVMQPLVYPLQQNSPRVSLLHPESLLGLLQG